MSNDFHLEGLHGHAFTNIAGLSTTTAPSGYVLQIVASGQNPQWMPASGLAIAHDIISSTHLDTDPADTPADDDVLFFKTADSKWHPQAVPSGTSVPSDTVTPETTFGISPAAGTGVEYSRGGHTHGSPANPVTGLEVENLATAATDTTLVLKPDGAGGVAFGAGGGGGGTPAFIGARVYHNASQSIATATVTALAMNSERFDTSAFHSTSVNNSRFTPPQNGYYEIGGVIQWAVNSTALRAVFVRLNGTTLIIGQGNPPTSADNAYNSCHGIYYLTTSDYVELCAFQNSGGGLNVNATGNISPEFWIALLGT